MVYEVDIWTILSWKVPVCQYAFVRLKRVQKTKYPVYSGKNIQKIKWVSHGPSGNRHTKASTKAFLLAPSGASRAHRQHYRATVTDFLVNFLCFWPISTVPTSINTTSTNFRCYIYKICTSWIQSMYYSISLNFTKWWVLLRVINQKINFLAKCHSI